MNCDATLPSRCAPSLNQTARRRFEECTMGVTAIAKGGGRLPFGPIEARDWFIMILLGFLI